MCSYFRVSWQAPAAAMKTLLCVEELRFCPSVCDFNQLEFLLVEVLMLEVGVIWS